MIQQGALPSIARALPRLMELAHRAVENGSPPFSALLLDAHGEIQNEAISVQGQAGFDSFGHAETRVLVDFDSHWSSSQRSGYWMVSTGEPCPFCASAISSYQLDGAAFLITQEWISELRGFHRYEEGKSSADIAVLIASNTTIFSRLDTPEAHEMQRELEELFRRQINT
jgi:tRNA(Arg) A34 adenosine deaminase TadA